MQSKALTVEDYLKELPLDRNVAISKIRDLLVQNLPKGFEERMSYGMIGYVVPHEIYTDGYHCNSKLPLPFMSIGSQKNFISLHHLGIYFDENLQKWVETEYPKHCKTKLDMGKGCLRFKKMDAIPFELIANLASRISVDEWITLYEKNLKR